MENYEAYIDLLEFLARQKDSGLDENLPKLWDYSYEELLHKTLSKMSAPLPNGQPSPFSAISKSSPSGIMSAVFLELIELLGLELNLKPSVDLYHHLKLLGVMRRPAEYPIIYLTFFKDPASIAANIQVQIPYRLKVYSEVNPAIYAITNEDAVIPKNEKIVKVSARLNKAGPIGDLKIGELKKIKERLPNIAKVTNDGSFIKDGAIEETPVQFLIRARDGLRTGNFPNSNSLYRGRVVTLPDFHSAALEFGAEKALPITLQQGVPGFFSGAIEIRVWPQSSVAGVKKNLDPLVLESQQFNVRAAEVIPLTGKISVSFSNKIPQRDKFNLIARAIKADINPPNGRWGDKELKKSIASSLEKVDGIFSVPKMDLINARTREKIEDMKIEPYFLFEVQSSLEIEYL